MRKSEGKTLIMVVMLLIDALLLLTLSYYRNQAFETASYKQNVYSKIAIMIECVKDELADSYLYNENYSISFELLSLLDNGNQKESKDLLQSQSDAYNKEINSEGTVEDLTSTYKALENSLNEIQEYNIELINQDLPVFKYDGLEIVLLVALIILLYNLFSRY